MLLCIDNTTELKTLEFLSYKSPKQRLFIAISYFTMFYVDFIREVCIATPRKYSQHEF